MTTGRAPERHGLENYRSRVRGSLLGGAIGDALGGPVEFWSLDRIRAECGRDGVKEYLSESVDGARIYGRITDDTQMTLFTVDGMIRASVRQDRGLGFTVGVLHPAYDRWLDTQLQDGPDGERDGWLINERWLYSRRAPGNTCLSALEVPRGGRRKLEQFGTEATTRPRGAAGLCAVLRLVSCPRGCGRWNGSLARRRRPPATPTATPQDSWHQERWRCSLARSCAEAIWIGRSMKR
ncbi:hypothetical protein GCM10022263_28090 [Nocardioides daeguensis]|uniref:ADP-ribosylglycohydrolase family protein n=1 Tax=Nocardioides daeguensis TaxID=908359 RepID=A0ABP6VTQ4_9ACTN